MVQSTHQPRRSRRPISSAVPAIAGMIAASAFAMGAFAFEVGSTTHRGLDAPSFSEPAGVEATSRVGPDQVEPPVVSLLARQAPMRRTGPLIALVIDDAGPDRLETLRAMALPVPITLAILPYAEDAGALDEQARSLGHETYIHLPMEPEGLADPGPHAITRHQSVRDQQARVTWAISRIPGATGLNNHMGSAITADGAAMRELLQPAREAGLVFLDSLTSPRSQAEASAQALGMTALHRDIFLDHDNDAAGIRRQIQALEALAEERGHAIAIGHPRTLTMNALEDWVSDAQNRGFQFVTLASLIELEANSSVDMALSGEVVSLVSSTE